MSFRITLYPRILLVLFCLGFLSLAQQTFGMPPHPDLEKQFREGKKALPDIIANPDILRQKGINQPPPRPGLREKFFQGAPAQGPSGNFNTLALLVDFSDKVHQVSASYFDTLIFGTGTGTVRDYYNQVSYGTLTIVTVHLPSTTGWFRAPQSYSYYANGQNGFGAYPQNAQKLVEDVVDAADSVVDFSQYDNNGDGYVDAIVVVHAGSGAELTGNPNDIWSHMWSITPRLKDGVYISPYSIEPEYWYGPGDMTLGVYCHELGHVLGLPDLYDTDYSSEGVGKWSLMGGGSWNGSGNMGGSPAHLDAWSRIMLDFASATVISQDTAGVSIPAVESAPQVYYVWNSGAANSEYFLMENRQATGYDAALPSFGLLIWHIDETMPDNDTECRDQQNCNCPSHFIVALEQADGSLNLENGVNRGDAGDSYPGSTNNRAFGLSSVPNSGSYVDCSSQVAITNISDPAAVMTADVSVGNAPSTATIALSTNSLSASCATGTDAPNQSFEVWNSGAGILNYTVSDNAYWLSCSPLSGDSSGEADTITVKYATAGLSIGNYSAVITVSAPHSTNKTQTINVSLKVANPNLTRIDLAGPMNGSTLLKAPTFTWMADGGLRDVFVVDIGYSPTGPFYSTGTMSGTSWAMPASTWSRISSGKPVYWRVRGADLNVKPRVTITSTQVWSFYKQQQ